ncbi:MAG: redoxin domain-containing protein [Nibricoccus sp.]
MIVVGQKLSVNFPVKVVQGGRAREVVFTQLLTRRTIISIYMRNNTPSCDRQVDELAEHAAEFDRLGYNLVAISRDTCGSHGRYGAKKGLPDSLVLVSDPGDLFATAADAVIDKQLYGRKYRGPARAAFILAQDATVLGVVEKVDAKTHAAQLRGVLAALGAD